PGSAEDVRRGREHEPALAVEFPALVHEMLRQLAHEARPYFPEKLAERIPHRIDAHAEDVAAHEEIEQEVKARPRPLHEMLHREIPKAREDRKSTRLNSSH